VILLRFGARLPSVRKIRLFRKACTPRCATRAIRRSRISPGAGGGCVPCRGQSRDRTDDRPKHGAAFDGGGPSRTTQPATSLRLTTQLLQFDAIETKLRKTPVAQFPSRHEPALARRAAFRGKPKRGAFASMRTAVARSPTDRFVGELQFSHSLLAPVLLSRPGPFSCGGKPRSPYARPRPCGGFEVLTRRVQRPRDASGGAMPESPAHRATPPRLARARRSVRHWVREPL
jgi:hypothetical protein